MVEAKAYVHLDENGTYRIIGKRITLDSIVYSYRKGSAPETIRQQFPALTLEEVFGAITYYLAQRDEVDAHMRRQEDQFLRLRADQDANPSAVIKRLMDVKQPSAAVENESA